MQIIKSVEAMQRLAKRWQTQKILIGFVPTMGYLHEGHLSLVRRARHIIGRDGKVVVSIYVNPTQFGPSEDFSRYPRNLTRDLKLCRANAVDIVFVPDDREMYPSSGDELFSTYVVEERLSKLMEGKSRPTHFRGVTTVVAKLFNIVLPNVAVFGAKDFQQTSIIKRMVRDLNSPVKIVVAPTVRDGDGLAVSSRNKYLKDDLRVQAVVLWRSIQKAREGVKKSPKPISSASLKADLKKFIEREPAAHLDYIEFFDPATLQPIQTIKHGAHMALAVFIGKTRLIDNGQL